MTDKIFANTAGQAPRRAEQGEVRRASPVVKVRPVAESDLCNARRTSTTGQAMILAVLTMGGIFLAATVVAGMLMTSQIRQATDFNASTAAIAAADAGIEWALYQYTHPGETVPALTTLSNGATVEVRCFDKDKHEVNCSEPVNRPRKVHSITSSGEFHGANRIFEISEVRPFVP
jgi:hypothetical protein